MSCFQQHKNLPSFHQTQGEHTDGRLAFFPTAATTCSFIPLNFVSLEIYFFSSGQSEVIGPLYPVVAWIGDDIILPCNLDPVMDALDMAVEWARPDLNPRFVFVWRDGVELESKKHPSYTNRTSLFTDELKNGNISLKISKVKLSDEGAYRCFFPELNKDTTVQLVVGAVSSPVISFAGLNKSISGVVLQCESAGWYPEPELLWLDGEGNLLSAGPTETLRGPDDLYTVSSRLTVEKRHSNNITCRVQQKKISQSRETHRHVPGKSNCIVFFGCKNVFWLE
uniref:Ig-like domain-containing protein n=1 Tax=Neolamprologus brichardi TaxID=32507 RepID=A0A3Q4GIX1_NEOBR